MFRLILIFSVFTLSYCENCVVENLVATCEEETTFPLDIKEKITKLVIHSKNITAVKNEYLNFPDLQEIDLSNCNIKYLDSDSFENLKELGILNLSHNKDLEISHNFLSSNSIKWLSLANNNISEWPENMFEDLKNLVTLDLTGNNIEKVEKALETSLQIQNLIITKSNYNRDELCALTPLKKVIFVSTDEKNNEKRNIFDCHAGVQNDEPQNEPQNDEPQNDEPQNDEPQNDEPQNDEPQHDEPQNDEQHKDEETKTPDAEADKEHENTADKNKEDTNVEDKVKDSETHQEENTDKVPEETEHKEEQRVEYKEEHVEDKDEEQVEHKEEDEKKKEHEENKEDEHKEENKEDEHKEENKEDEHKEENEEHTVDAEPQETEHKENETEKKDDVVEEPKEVPKDHIDFCKDNNNWNSLLTSNCEEQEDKYNCAIKCPDGKKADSEVSSSYSCIYSTGIFEPELPKCLEVEPEAIPDKILSDVPNELEADKGNTDKSQETPRAEADPSLENDTHINELGVVHQGRSLQPKGDAEGAKSGNEVENLQEKDDNLAESKETPGSGGSESINGSSVVLGIIVVVVVVGALGMIYKYWKNHRGYQNTRTEDVEEGGKEMKTISINNKPLAEQAE